MCALDVTPQIPSISVDIWTIGPSLFVLLTVDFGFLTDFFEAYDLAIVLLKAILVGRLRVFAGSFDFDMESFNLYRKNLIST